MKKLKKGRPAPLWLVDLKEGKYYTSDLMEISGSTIMNVLRVMERHGGIKEYEICNGRTKVFFNWKGFIYQ